MPMDRATGFDEALRRYLVEASPAEPHVLALLRRETDTLPLAAMRIPPEHGRFMAFLIELTGARRVLEVGTFTGYSALWMALALPPGGRIVTCDVSEEWTNTAQRYWRAAEVHDKIQLRLGPALETLDGLIEEGAAPFDFAFVDADKLNHDGYYERALSLLRSGGMVALDNALWGGKVADPEVQDRTTRAVRALNEKVRDDPRVTVCLLPIGDGLLLARKR